MHFTKAETQLIADARHTMYEGGNRGPVPGDKSAIYLDCWWGSIGVSRQRSELLGTKRALQHQLERQERQWVDAKRKFKQYPHWTTDWAFRDRLPEDYRRRVLLLRRAVRLIDKAIEMCPDEAINQPPHHPIPRAVMKRVRAAMAQVA